MEIAIKIKDNVINLDKLTHFFPEKDRWIVFYTSHRERYIQFEDETERDKYLKEIISRLNEYVDIIDIDSEINKKTTISNYTADSDIRIS